MMDEKSEENENKCGICLEDNFVEKDLVITECKHKFHFNCIIRYIKNQTEKEEKLKCPMCRNKFTEQIINPIIEENTTIYQNIDNELNTIETTNLSYMGNRRAERNENIGINLTTGLWEMNINADTDNHFNYRDDISEINSDYSSDSEIGEFMAKIKDELC